MNPDERSPLYLNERGELYGLFSDKGRAVNAQVRGVNTDNDEGTDWRIYTDTITVTERQKQ